VTRPARGFCVVLAQQADRMLSSMAPVATPLGPADTNSIQPVFLSEIMKK